MRKARFFILVLVGMATGGLSTSEQRIGLFTWVQRAFAPTSKHMENVGSSQDFNRGQESNLKHWMQRALTPTAAGVGADKRLGMLKAVSSAHRGTYAFCEAPSILMRKGSTENRCALQNTGDDRRSTRTAFEARMHKETGASARGSGGWKRWSNWAQHTFSSLSFLKLQNKGGLWASSSVLMPPTDHIPLTESRAPVSMVMDESDSATIASFEDYSFQNVDYEPLSANIQSGLKTSENENTSWRASGGEGNILNELLGISQVKELVSIIVDLLKNNSPWATHQSVNLQSQNEVLDRRRQHGSLDDVADSLHMAITATLNGMHLEHNWHRIQHLYQDSAAWVLGKALQLQPDAVAGAIGGAGQATLELLGEVNKQLVGTLEEEVARLRGVGDAGQATLTTLSHAALARLAHVNSILARWLENNEGAQLGSAVSAAGAATAARLADVNRMLTAVVEREVGQLVHRFDDEMLSLIKDRPLSPPPAHGAAAAAAAPGIADPAAEMDTSVVSPSSPVAAAAAEAAEAAATAAVAAPPVVMVMDTSRRAHLLTYGEAIPELLYGHVGGADVYAASMRVALTTDPEGNVYLGPADPRRGAEGSLPMSSDVLWLRQMAAYSAAGRAAADAAEEAEGWEAEAAAAGAKVRVAAVTIPVNARGDVLITQRAFRGVYDGMWVFPGGHVDGGEALSGAAVREVLEETGIEVDASTLQPLAVWEGTVTSRKKQFCVVFFAATTSCGSAVECTMELQVKEVHRAAWVPRELVPRILDNHVLHRDITIDGIRVTDGRQEPAAIRLSDIQQGLGQGHQFALRAFLDARPEYMTRSSDAQERCRGA